MRLTCPNCGAEYEVPAGMIPPGGKHVQCSNCHTRWFMRSGSVRSPEAGLRLVGGEDREDAPEERDFVWEGAGGGAAPQEDGVPEETADSMDPAAADRDAAETAEAKVAGDAPQETSVREDTDSGEIEPESGAPAQGEPAEDQHGATDPEAAPAAPGLATVPAYAPPVERAAAPDTAGPRPRRLELPADAMPPAPPPPRPANRLAAGLLLGFLIVAALVSAYVWRAPIAAAVPAAAPALTAWGETVDKARVWIDDQINTPDRQPNG